MAGRQGPLPRRRGMVGVIRNARRLEYLGHGREKNVTRGVPRVISISLLCVIGAPRNVLLPRFSTIWYVGKEDMFRCSMLTLIPGLGGALGPRGCRLLCRRGACLPERASGRFSSAPPHTRDRGLRSERSGTMSCLEI